jgi:hypothetical protein
MRALLIISVLFLFCGCAHHHPAVPGHLNYTVDLAACHGTMRMLNCNSDSPPNCQHRYVDYDKDCEQLDALAPAKN